MMNILSYESRGLEKIYPKERDIKKNRYLIGRWKLDNLQIENDDSK
jgi:hypothetical protein